MRTLSLALCTALICACSPPQAQTPLVATTTLPAAAGIGVCHWIAPNGLPAEVDFGTETTTVMHWKHLEPWPGVYVWDRFDEYVRARQHDGLHLWLAPQTVGADLHGQPKAPQWVMDMGAVWHTAGCSDHKGIFAPWDRVYLQRLPLLLAALNDHINAQDQQYQDTISGIVIMSGGVYGETHLYEWSETCNLETALRDYYQLGLTDWEFSEAYSESVLRILDLYMEAFDQRLPVMVQLGRRDVDEWVMRYGSATYGRRMYAKWAGWAPTNVGDGRDHVRRDANEHYTTLFRAYGRYVHCGFEPGHPVQEWLGPDQYSNAVEYARYANLSFVCFQAGATLWTARAQPWFAALDAQLEANANAAARPTPTVTATPTPTSSPTPTPTSTPIRTPEPLIILHCECSPVTVTPSP